MARTQTDQHTDKWVRGLEAPASGNKVHYDGAVPGFGVRVTAAGAKSFVLNYRTKAGRERRYTIGSLGDWTISAARQKAKELRRVIDEGGDPLAELQDQREAPTVAALATRAMKEHFSRKAPDYAADVQRMISKYILPSLQHLKVADVSFGDT